MNCPPFSVFAIFKSLFVDFFCFLVYIARDVTDSETENEYSDILTFICFTKRGFLKLPRITQTEYLLTISIQISSKQEMRGEKKISIRRLLVDPVTNSQN